MPPKYYYDFYLFVVSLLTFLSLSMITSNRTLLAPQKSNTFKTHVLSILIILFIGFRPIDGAFVDMTNYNAYYQLIKGSSFEFTTDTGNLIFDNMFNWLASEEFDSSILFLIMGMLYFGCMSIACNKLFKNNAFIPFLVCLGALSTFSYGTNGIKAGVAASLFLCAIAYHERKLVAVFFLFCSLGFHHSMVLPIFVFICVYFSKGIKIGLCFWFLCLILSLAHVTFFQILFAGFSDEQGARYLNQIDADWGLKMGFRYDFVLYSAVPIILGYWLLFKKQLCSSTYIFLLNLYLFTNGVWMLCMYAAFTNRIAYLSWFMYPIVLIYPLFKKEICHNQYKLVQNIVLGHLGFTLFMTYIYY